MKKIILILILTFNLIGCSSSNVESTVIKDISWGMSNDAVREKESDLEILDDGESNYTEGRTFISYNEELFGLPFSLMYTFDENDSLMEILYKTTFDPKKNYDYMNYFDLIKATLTEKYGVPRKDKAYWLNVIEERIRNNRSLWNEAEGILISSEWVTDDSIITLSLVIGDHMSIFYRPVNENYVSEKEKL